ncbi:MAG: hypothetical protein RMK15_00350 [Chloroflexota bacterium]|nr:hypothetical protein [Dehalococcoidia bacterium]MDW8045721.1 hypothetical protein [Chloroflexota bacterium]
MDPVVRRRRRPSWWRRIAMTAALVAVLFAAYVMAMQATLPSGGTVQSRETRDQLHALIHGGALAFGFAAGWALGWASERNGFAYAVTISVVLAFLMAFAMMASWELACSGGIVVLRAWTCG